MFTSHAVIALAVKNYPFAKVGCRPPGGNVRYSALESVQASLSPIGDATATAVGCLPSNFTAGAVKSDSLHRSLDASPQGCYA